MSKSHSTMKTKTTSTSTSVTAEPTAKPLPRKLGANHSETAKRPRKHDNNFKQSKDLREDRGIRQLKSSPKSQSARGGR
ncbi:MAG: hypothetical protein B7Z47_04545 [Chthoniobacter sp. 12-60-6]|nr:MAG: hypothetical protein B7Z47_04545 [Chthoniobacter sp. 12-60-6]